MRYCKFNVVSANKSAETKPKFTTVEKKVAKAEKKSITK